ncbi:MAG: Flp pilus assembly complex ATPase component TadA [Lentisphaeria bacterium]|nr:Flp pilus assembly complex ATPase component TadA [Lentisphaeria bacterium]
MPDIVIALPGYEETTVQLFPGIYRVGSSPASHISLSEESIQPRHCRFEVSEHGIKVFDLCRGTFINGSEIGDTGMDFTPGDELRIGNGIVYYKGYKPQLNQKAVPRMEEAAPQPTPSAPPPPKPVKRDDSIPILEISGISPANREVVQEIKRLAHVELLKRLNLKRLALSGTAQEVLEEQAKQTIHEIMQALNIPLPSGVTREKIEHELIHEAIGLGPLEDLINRDDISEIMVNGPDQVYVEHKGVLYRTDMAFADDQQVISAIERIVSPLGRRIDESSPMVDARLKDGSRVNAIIPPLSLVGPSITIRKFSKTPLQVDNLIAFGSISRNMATFLDLCVKLRKNIIISGGTGSGKTTLLNILSSFLPDTDRIITIEDAAELQLRQDHVVRLESRPPNIEGKGEITIRDLVRNSLRMRPDRIVIGECRGGEALDMLQAMNTGHDGSLTTIHANSPRDALARLETLVLMAGFDLPLRAIREQIASAISIIVQITREKDGSRKVIDISEITRMEGDIITMQTLFEFKQDGWSEDGKIIGRYVPSGSMPSFMEDIKRSGLPLDLNIFSEGRQGPNGGM